MASFKGDFDDNDDLEAAFGTLLVDYKDNSSSEEELTNSLAPSFFTLVKSFITKSSIVSYIIPYAKTLIDNLNN